jgi:hypothetical protein
MLNEGIKNTQFYTLSTFVIPFYYGFRTVINYGYGSAKVRNYITVPGSVPAKNYGSYRSVLVPQHCLTDVCLSYVAGRYVYMLLSVVSCYFLKCYALCVFSSGAGVCCVQPAARGPDQVSRTRG